MHHFTSLKAIAYAVFSKALYRDVYLRWQGLGFGYLLILNMLILTPVIAYSVISFEQNLWADDGNLSPPLRLLSDEIISQLPPMVFENGELSTEAEQPYHITMTIDGNKQLFAVIDLDGGLTQLRESNAVLLLSRKRVYANMGKENIETRDWAEVFPEPTVIDAARAQAMLQEGIDWLRTNRALLILLFGTLLWVGTVLVMFIYRAIQAALLGLSAQLIARKMQVVLNYPDAVRLSCMAMTPPILFDLFFGLVLFDQMHVILFLLITIGYQVFALRTIKEME